MDNFEDFVDNSRYQGIGDNWVDYMTQLPGGAGGNDDECATVVTFPEDCEDDDYIFFNGGIQDWKTPGDHTDTVYHYINNCDPGGGNPL